MERTRFAEEAFLTLEENQSSKICQSDVKQTHFQNLKKKRKRIFFYHRGTLILLLLNRHVFEKAKYLVLGEEKKIIEFTANRKRHINFFACLQQI